MERGRARSEGRTHRRRLEFTDHAHQAAHVVGLAARKVDALLHRPLLERARHGALVLVDALGAEAQRLAHRLGREAPQRVPRRARTVAGAGGCSRRGGRRRVGVRAHEAQDLLEEVVREHVVDEPIAREDDNVVPLDLDGKLLRVSGGHVLGVGARLERVVEAVLLLLGAEDVLVAADDAAAAVAEVGEAQLVVAQDGEERRRRADRALWRRACESRSVGEASSAEEGARAATHLLLALAQRLLVRPLHDVDRVDLVVVKEQFVVDVLVPRELCRAVCGPGRIALARASAQTRDQGELDRTVHELARPPCRVGARVARPPANTVRHAKRVGSEEVLRGRPFIVSGTTAGKACGAGSRTESSPTPTLR